MHGDSAFTFLLNRTHTRPWHQGPWKLVTPLYHMAIIRIIRLVNVKNAIVIWFNYKQLMMLELHNVGQQFNKLRHLKNSSVHSIILSIKQCGLVMLFVEKD